MELNSTSHGSKVKSVSPAEKSLTVLKLIGPSKAFETNLKFGVFPEAETRVVVWGNCLLEDTCAARGAF